MRHSECLVLWLLQIGNDFRLRLHMIKLILKNHNIACCWKNTGQDADTVYMLDILSVI